MTAFLWFLAGLAVLPSLFVLCVLSIMLHDAWIKAREIHPTAD